jgi:hypothetical protein
MSETVLSNLPADVQVRIALEPVKCIDCAQYVPHGWINDLAVKCPKNIGASGVQYGHRVPREVPGSVVDSIVNRYVREANLDLTRPSLRDRAMEAARQAQKSRGTDATVAWARFYTLAEEYAYQTHQPAALATEALESLAEAGV